MHKFLPILLIALIVTTLVSNISVRRYLAYNLNISGSATNPCCKIEDVLNASGNFDSNASEAIFDNQQVQYPSEFLSSLNQNTKLAETNVLATYNPSGQEKWIDVNLDTQTLTAYEGDKIYMQYQISSGLWNSTPKGTFEIWYKTRNQTMKGGSKELGTYYNLPNVPYNMYFYQGNAIHGAYWHHNWGHPMSHGCINEPVDKAAQIFEWAGPTLAPNQNAIRSTPENPGTRVVIH